MILKTFKISLMKFINEYEIIEFSGTNFDTKIKTSSMW